jgi:hypothetical protein
MHILLDQKKWLSFAWYTLRRQLERSHFKPCFDSSQHARSKHDGPIPHGFCWKLDRDGAVRWDHVAFGTVRKEHSKNEFNLLCFNDIEAPNLVSFSVLRMADL